MVAIAMFWSKALHLFLCGQYWSAMMTFAMLITMRLYAVEKFEAAEMMAFLPRAGGMLARVAKSFRLPRPVESFVSRFVEGWWSSLGGSRDRVLEAGFGFGGSLESMSTLCTVWDGGCARLGPAHGLAAGERGGAAIAGRDGTGRPPAAPTGENARGERTAAIESRVVDSRFQNFRV